MIQRPYVHLVPLVTASQVCKRFHPRSPGLNWALEDVSFQLEAGEILCLLGPNGAGKTTLLKMLSSLILPDSGRIEIAGHDTADEPRLACRRIGWVPADDRGFYPRLTARENLLFFGALCGLSKSQCLARLVELEEQWNLNVPPIQPYQELSSGNKCRLGLIRALLHDPALLLLDEPTDHLDPRSSDELRQHLIKMIDPDSGRSAIWVTQNLTEAWKLKCPISVLHKGCLTQSHASCDSLADLEASYAWLTRPPSQDD